MNGDGGPSGEGGVAGPVGASGGRDGGPNGDAGVNGDGGPSGEVELAREIERVAQRLRVLGPRLAARLGPPGRPAAGGAAAGELATAEARAGLSRIRDGLQELADLAADAEGRRRRRVPELAPHGLGDQVLVLGHDLLAVADPAARAAGARVLAQLRRSL